jgi:hypothetical protein
MLLFGSGTTTTDLGSFWTKRHELPLAESFEALKIISCDHFFNSLDRLTDVHIKRPDENVLSMERSLVAIILKRIQEFCVNTRFFYLLERTFTSGRLPE